MKKQELKASLRRITKYILLATIVAVIALMGWIIYLMLLIKPASDVSAKFIDNLKAKDSQAALALTTENFQKSQSKADLEQAVNSPQAEKILKQKYKTRYKKIVSKSPLTVDFIYSFNYKSVDYEVSMSVVKQNNEFKVDKASIDSAALKRQFFGQ